MESNDTVGIKIPAEVARRFSAEALVKVGLPASSADKVAELMIEADLSGASAHGIFRLGQYVQRLKLGAINPTPMIKIETTGAGTAVVDGDNGMGHLVVAQAVERAIEQACTAGVSWVGIHCSNHAGAAGTYAARIAEQGMVGLYSAVASANHMGVWGGAEPLLGTNPLAIAIPGGRHPVVLDIATSIVSYGTIKNYRLQGWSLPDDWMVGVKDGGPITDPARSNEGLLLPVGGYKGAGLALMLGLLAGSLNGAPFGRDVVDFNAHPGQVCDTGQFVIALDVSRFRPFADFISTVDDTLDDLRSSARLPGHDAIRLPGDHRHRRREAQMKNGLSLSPELTMQLDLLAAELGIVTLRGKNAAA